jgi:hypothetical protein
MRVNFAFDWTQAVGLAALNGRKRASAASS